MKRIYEVVMQVTVEVEAHSAAGAEILARQNLDDGYVDKVLSISCDED